MAKPLKLDEQRISILAQCFERGMPDNQSAATANISRETLRRWKETGEAEQARQDAGTQPNPDFALHVALVAAIKNADATFVQTRLDRIAAASEGGAILRRVTTTKRNGDIIEEVTLAQPQWQADAWLLERRHYQDFARRTMTEVTGKEGGPMELTERSRQDMIVEGRARIIELAPPSRTKEAS